MLVRFAGVTPSKIEKHSIDELKNLAYDKILIYERRCKDLDLCHFSYVIRRNVSTDL